VFKEKALFNFVRTFLRELDLLALDLNLSLFDFDDDGEDHHQKPRDRRAISVVEEETFFRFCFCFFYIARETMMMMVCKKGVFCCSKRVGGFWVHSYIHLLYALRVVRFDHHRHVISFQ